MQSLWDTNELDKNNFCHLVYAVKMKKTVEVPIAPQSHGIADPTSEFNID